MNVDQQIWVRQGTIEVTLDGVAHRLAEDDCFAMHLDAPVAYRNPTRKPARYVVAIATERSRSPRSVR